MSLNSSLILPTHHDGFETRVLGTLPPRPGFQLASPGAVEILPESAWVEFEYEGSPVQVKDQNGYGACVGHATSTALEWARWLAGMTYVDLSAWFVYANLCGGIDRGASISDALDLMTRTGTCPFTDVPYGTINPGRLSPQARQAAGSYKIEIGGPTPSFAEMMSETQRGRPGNFSIGVGSGFNDLDADGVPPTTGNLDHSVCYGLGAKKGRSGEWLIKCQNSWTTRWGLGGYFFVRESSIYRGNDSWSIVAATDAADDPTDPPVVPS